MTNVTASGSSSHACTVVTVGTYDGVHLGHRRLIDETKRSAQERGCTSVVVTFAVHPSKVLRPDAPVPLLSTLDEKIELLKETGIDDVVVLEFDSARARESAEDFVIRELVGSLSVAEVVVGSNFRFGYKRRGDVGLLKRLGNKYGFVTSGVELVLDDEHHSVVSSTRIRALIATGEILEAEHLLGRPYVLTGMVDASSQLRVADELLVPAPGDYLVTISASRTDRSAEDVVLRDRAKISATGTITLERLAGDDRFNLSRPVAVAFGADRDQSVEGDR